MPYISHYDKQPAELKNRGPRRFPEDAVGLHYKQWAAMVIRKGYFSRVGERHAFIKQSMNLTTRHAWLHVLTEFDPWSGRFSENPEVFRTCDEYLEKFFGQPQVHAQRSAASR